MPVENSLEYCLSKTEDVIGDLAVPGVDAAHRSHWLSNSK